MFADEPGETMRRVVENLDGEYGPKRKRRDLGPLDELILTILSQQNSSASTKEVFAELKPMPVEQFKEVITGPAKRATEAGRPLELARQRRRVFTQV